MKNIQNGDDNASSLRDDELLQLIGQYLCNKGYRSAYNELTKSSGIKLEHESATNLRRAILDGNWDQAELALENLKKNIPDKKLLPEITFCILEQKFLELLEANEVMPAVALLRNRLTPLNINRDRVHLLASCILCRTSAEIRAQAGGWAGANGDSRMALVERIQHFMPAQTMLPPKRLELLINESIRAQIKNCIFHNEPTDLTIEKTSLLENHTCSIDKFPVVPIQRLRPSQSEVWFCQFSPNGHFLATCGKECNIELWTVNPSTRTISIYKSISTNSHQNYLCWAPDSSKFAVCFSDEQSVVIVFDPITGNIICQQKVNDDDSFSAASFFADSRTLAFGGLKGSFYIMDTMDDGRILTIVEGYRVQAMAAVYRMHPINSRLNHLTFSENDSSSSGDTSDRAPGGPESSSNFLNSQLTPSRQFYYAESLSQYDELLIADTMNRVSLFRFGYTTKPPTVTGTSPIDGTSNSNLQNQPVSLVTDPFSASQQSEQRRWRNPVESSLLAHGLTGITPGSNFWRASLAPSQLVESSRSSMLGLYPLLPLDVDLAQSRPVFNRTIPPMYTLDLIQQHIHANIVNASATVNSLSTRSSSAVHGHAPRVSVSNPTLGNWFPGQSTHQAQPYFIAATRANAPSGTLILIPSLATTQPSTTEATATQTGQTIPTTTLATTSSSSQVIPTTSISRGARPSTTSSNTYVMATTLGSFSAGNSENGANLPTPVSSTNVEPPISSTSANVASSSGHTVPTDSQVSSANLDSAIGGSGSNYALREQLTLFRESNPINSLVLDRSGRLVLVGTQKLGLQLWDLAAGAVVDRFVGSKQENNKLHPTIGGVNDDFVACGSEDGKMHYWRCGMGYDAIHTVRAAGISNETTVINCVHWNPVIPDMLASVNDEGELFIWAPLKYADLSNGLDSKQNGLVDQSNADGNSELMDWLQQE